MNKKIYKIIIILIVVFILIKLFNSGNNEINIGDAIYYCYEVDDSIDDGVIEEVNMDFIDCRNIGVKMDSLKISEINLELGMSFKVGEGRNTNSFDYCAAIYDSYGSMYMFRHPYQDYTKEKLKFYEKRNIKRDRNWDVDKSAGVNEHDLTVDKYENGIISTTLSGFSIIGYGSSTNPNANKSKGMANNLFIEIWDIGATSNVIIELKLPENFYKNSCVHYEFKNKDKDFGVKTAICDDKSFSLIAKISGIYDVETNFINSFDNLVEAREKWTFEEIYKYLYITDENNNRYDLNNYVIAMIPDQISVMFDITRNQLTDKLYVHTIIDDEERTYEIERKD